MFRIIPINFQKSTSFKIGQNKVQSLLHPGETLLWAHQNSTRNKVKMYWPGLLFQIVYISIMAILTFAAYAYSNFIGHLVFTLLFAILIILLSHFKLRETTTPLYSHSLYAITSKRIFIFDRTYKKINFNQARPLSAPPTIKKRLFGRGDIVFSYNSEGKMAQQKFVNIPRLKHVEDILAQGNGAN